ncbi:MAG: SRPBCC family protein [Actinomycetota bacterium]|nr:SRPBCC family protein [Actinomycetota bacterium]
MRYADTPTAEVEIVVDAPIDRLWALITDIELPARFSSEFRGAEWLDAGPALDARFKGRNEHAAIGAWEVTCVVTQCEVDRVFEWAVGDADDASAKWRFELEPSAHGVLLRQWCQIGPAPSGLTAAIMAMPDKEERIVGRRLEEFRTNMQATVEGIKRVAETTP